MTRRVVKDGGRADRPALTRDRIVRAALEIIDRDGIEALSMRRLGAELGVDPMAVYYHVPNKAALFDGVVEAVFAAIDIDPDTLPQTGNWRDLLVLFMRRLREVLRAHPNALPVIATRPAYTPSVLTFGDRAVAALEDSGFGSRDILIMVNCLRTYTVGHVIAELGQPVGGPTASPEEAAAIIEAYPNLARAISGGYQPDEQYELGLQAMLDGFEGRIGPTRNGARTT